MFFFIIKINLYKNYEINIIKYFRTTREQFYYKIK